MRLKHIRLDQAVFRAVANDAKRLLKLSWKQVARKTGLDEGKIKNFVYKGTGIGASDYDALADFVETCIHGDAFLYFSERYPSLFPDRAVVSHPLGIALAQWADATDQHRTAFYKRCVGGKRGRFLTLRRDGEGYIVGSLMFVSCPAEGELLPRFRSVRPTQSGRRKLTTGFIFQVHGRIYAVGKLDLLSGLRFTTLHLQDHGARSDLFGIRLGISRKTGDTFATRIYCYQLGGGRTLDSIRPLLGRWHPDRPGTPQPGLPGLAEIYEMLDVGGSWDNGLRFRN